MNTETDTPTGSGNNLQGAFGDRGTKLTAISYGHPHGAEIIEDIKKIIIESETGRAFVEIFDYHSIPLNIMKGTGESGFSPELNTIFLQIPGRTSKATGETIISFAKAVREADQEYAGFKAPDPTKDVIQYAGFMHARNLDSLWYVCKMIKELTNSSSFSVLLDSLTNLGLHNVYKAFLEGVSKEELYDYYAEAYEERGSI